MFLSQPLLNVLIGRDIRDIDEFLRQPSFGDLADPFSIPSLRGAVDRELLAIKEGKRIAVFGDYDCDGVLASHLLQSGLQRFGAKVGVCLPHRDDGYGLSAPAVHQFSLRGTHLLLTVDNGINAHSAVRLARRLGIEVIVIDHHRIQQKADTLAVWSDEFCGAGLAAMFMIGMAVRVGWTLGLERTFGGLTADAAYVRTASFRLPRVSYPNAYPGAEAGFASFTDFDSSGTVTGGFGFESVVTHTAHSPYNALQMSLAGQVGHGGPSLQAGYTWGKSLDDVSGLQGGTGSVGAVVSSARRIHSTRTRRKVHRIST